MNNVVYPHACWHCLTRLFFSREKKSNITAHHSKSRGVQELYSFVFSGPEATESAGELVKSLAVAQFIVRNIDLPQKSLLVEMYD